MRLNKKGSKRIPLNAKDKGITQVDIQPVPWAIINNPASSLDGPSDIFRVFTVMATGIKKAKVHYGRLTSLIMD